VHALRPHHPDQDSKMVEITFDAPADEARIKARLAEIEYPVAA
jgi:hypothetical protein